MFKCCLLYWSLALYSLSLFSEDKQIVVVIASYNNQDFVKLNLNSVLNQTYSNYRVIYVDDASNDKTLSILTEILRGHPKKNRFKIIKNRIHQGAMANQYMAIHLCQKEEIVVILDGDDWFFSSETLAVVNQNYQDPDVWITWGSYIEYPSNKIGGCSRPLSDEALCKALHRKNSWGTSHLRTFYAGLFQQIRKKDLEYQGQFVSSCCDLAQMFPMLEMAREKAKFLKEILYVYNCKNPISDFRIHMQERNKIEQHIRALPMYKKIESFR